MKNHVELDHSTKFDAFMSNKDQAMDLYTKLNINTNVSYFSPAAP